MRFAYAGTAPFAELVLEGLVAAGRVPVVLVTNPDRPRGRHGTPQPPRIKLLAEELDVPVLQPERLSDPEAVERLLAAGPDVFVVCAYGQIVTQARPRRRRDRRGAPVSCAALARRRSGGARADGRGDRAGRLHVAHDGRRGRGTRGRRAPGARAPGRRRRTSLRAPGAGGRRGSRRDARRHRRRHRGLAPAGGRGHLRRQDRAGTTRRSTGAGPRREIADQVRALSPHIGAVTELAGRRTRIWRASPGEGPVPEAGPDRLVIAAGQGWLDVLELQQEGRKRDGGRRVPARRRPQSAGAVTAEAEGHARDLRG